MARAKKAAAPIHPAIVALREAHAAAFPGIERHSCCASDLVHDERAIALYPASPFAWIMTPCSTHMMRVLALAPGVSGDTSFLRAVTEATSGPFLFAFWDGAALVHVETVDALIAAYLRAAYRLRIADLKTQRKPFADTLKQVGDCSDGYYANAIRKIDREIEELENMSWTTR